MQETPGGRQHGPDLSPFPDLTRFFAPRNVALVGATEDLSKFGGRCMRQTLDFGFQGGVFPVNPKRDLIFGRDCFASVLQLPVVPDHVGIILPAAAVPQTLEQCAERGVPFVTIFTSGFAETGEAEGRALQQRVMDIARAGNIRMMGPNCNGMVNFVDAFALTSTATISGPRAAPGDLGVVSQSGGAGQVNVMWRAQQAGLGVNYQVSCGNACDLDLTDYAAFMLEQPSTRVVLMLAERIADGERLRALARRADALGKPIVMVKVGRTQAGSRAAASHTGAITGADEVCDAALRQMGIIRVDDCRELYETAMILRGGKLAGGHRAAATAISGGNLVMVADLGAAEGIEFPEYSQATRDALGALLPGFGAASNPTDLTAAAIGQQDTYILAAEVILGDPCVDALVPVITFAPASEIRGTARLASESDKLVPLLWTGKASNDAALTHAALVAEGHAVYSDALTCMRSLRRAMDYAAHIRGLAQASPQRPAGTDPKALRQRLLAADGPMTEVDSKGLLALYGLPVTRERLATSAHEAVQIASEIAGSVALKVQSADIPHKTEAGGVALGLSDAAGVAQAYAQIVASAKAYLPDAYIEGVVVQEMVDSSVEMLLGVSRDPTFGLVLTVGLGGIFVEIMRDVAHRLPPVSHDEALRVIGGLRGAALLRGARGRPAADIEALADAIVRVSWLAHDARDLLDELDINPLCVLPAGRGTRVVDALVVPRGKSAAE